MPPRRSASKNKKAGDEEVETVARATTPAEVHEKKKQQLSGKAPLNPRTEHLEWNGVAGATATVFLLPCIVLLMNTLCSAGSANTCSLSWFFTTSGLSFSDAVSAFWSGARTELRVALSQVPLATAIVLAWHAFHCAFYLWFPLGERGVGQPLRNGKTLKYNFSAFWSMIVSYAFFVAGHFLFKWFDWGFLVDLYLPLAIASIAVSAVMGILLYVASYRSDDVLLATGGNSGHFFYDFFVGRELNPRLGELDFKFMYELRPGLIGWTLIACAYVVRSAEVNFAAEGGYLAPAMLPIYGAALANLWYVTEGLWYESGNVTMMDIVYDGFGFMLAFGDIAWVPFLYALQCRFLYLYPAVGRSLPLPYTVFCAGFYLAGWFTFRGSNSDKDRFRKDPKDPRVAHLKTMSTQRGTKLIISGWWGICRHPNYVGDWLMVVATSLFTGWWHVLPYFQVVYFAVLLVHRQLRDEEWMQKKYSKEDWDAYCKAVPYRLIPYVY